MHRIIMVAGFELSFTVVLPSRESSPYFCSRLSQSRLIM